MSVFSGAMGRTTLWLALMPLLSGCFATGNAKFMLRYHIDSRKQVDYARVPVGTFKHPCTLVSLDGQYTIPSGQFDATRLWQITGAFKAKAGDFDNVSNWGDLYLMGASVPFTMACGDERFNARVYFGALPRQFAATPVFRYDIEIGESAWAAARSGYMGYALGLHRWGWTGEEVADRITWLIAFTRGPFPPLTEDAKAAGEIAHETLTAQ
jgi:hypothetical protein